MPIIKMCPQCAEAVMDQIKEILDCENGMPIKSINLRAENDLLTDEVRMDVKYHTKELVGS